MPLHFDWIFFILAGNKGNYIVSDDFEIQSDPTIDCRVIDPRSIEKKKYLLENYSKYFDDLLAFM